MKIRIKGNSIRYRLTKSEVETFSRTGSFEEVAHFGDAVFIYRVHAKEGIETLDAQFKNHTITLFLNKEKSKDWFKTDKVGFSERVKKTDGTVLTLLLEKDFACLDERDEDQSDNYPNPKIELG